MTHWKLLAHDYRPPVQGGEPVWDGATLPWTLPPVDVDTSGSECAAGWNSVADLAAGFGIIGLWPTGRPATVLAVEPTGTVVVRGDNTRSSGLTILRRATEAEVRAGMRALAAPFGVHADRLADSQWEWFTALGRPDHDAAAVEAGLRVALAVRGLDWTLRRRASARDAWDAWGARDAWAATDAWIAKAARDATGAWAAKAAKAAWNAWTAWNAWDAWAAWAAWDAKDALVVEAAALMGWTRQDPLLLTTGLRDAYRAGLAVALPSGPGELGWAMEPEVGADRDTGGAR